jgi:membrane protein YqaA with SNARE-associated domain
MQTDWIDIPSLKRKHRYYLRSGFYGFLIKNVIRIAVLLFAVAALFIVFEKRVIDMDALFNSFFKNMQPAYVFLLFIFSESFFGLIPPDFFIIWARRFSNPWLIVSVLAVISYLGGIVSYYIGFRIRKIKRLNAFLTQKFRYHFRKIRRWGSIFIIVAALFPLPYSAVCILTGLMKFPLSRFVFLGWVRILRFYIYALVLYGLIEL